MRKAAVFHSNVCSYVMPRSPSDSCARLVALPSRWGRLLARRLGSCVSACVKRRPSAISKKQTPAAAPIHLLLYTPKENKPDVTSKEKTHRRSQPRQTVLARWLLLLHRSAPLRRLPRSMSGTWLRTRPSTWRFRETPREGSPRRAVIF